MDLYSYPSTDCVFILSAIAHILTRVHSTVSELLSRMCGYKVI